MKFRDILGHIPKTNNSPCAQCKCFTIDQPSARLQAALLLQKGELYTNIQVAWSREDVFPKLEILKSALDSGCTLCGTLRAFLLSPEVGDVVAGTTVKIRAIYPNVSTQNFRPLSLKFEFKLVTDGVEKWKQLTFVLAAPAESPATKLFRSIRRDHPLEHSSTIQGWLKECENSHVHCKTSTSQAFPTRVIDVRSTDPRLISTAGKTGRYAALSHCWGLSADNPIEAQYLLKESNIDTLMQRIAFEDLPKNFQDGVTVTRLLGLDYLWIDSLCIIQDSPADKAKEIKGMVNVYGNAWVTICATSAPNSYAGFLGAREPISEPVLVMPFFPRGFLLYPPFMNGTYNFYLRKNYEYIAGEWSTDVETSDWNKRGWTYQERLISRRMLHFAKNGVYFECLTSDYSEAGSIPREAVFESKIGRGPDTRKLGFFEYFSSQSLIDLPRVYETYYWFANEYSQRRLSFGGDREAAFSALVSQFARLLKSEHFHGLWLNDIYRGLLWRPSEQTKARDLVQYQANKGPMFPHWPSWSWQSSVYRTTWSGSHLWTTPLKLQPPEKEDVKIIHSTASNYSTKLLIKAVLVQVDMPLKRKDPTEFHESKYNKRQFALIMVDNQEYGSAWFDDGDAEKHIVNGKAFLLQIGQRDLSVSAAQFRNNASGIVLTPSNEENQYRRVGYFEIDTVEHWNALFEGQEETVVTLV